jgi:hypothetical protein
MEQTGQLQIQLFDLLFKELQLLQRQRYYCNGELALVQVAAPGLL